MVGFKAVVQSHDEGMVQHLTDFLLVANNGCLLVLDQELSRNGLQSVELSICQTPNQIDLAESPNRQALEDVVFLQRRRSIGVLELEALQGDRMVQIPNP